MSIKAIAVIGSGAAALALASALPPSYQVTVITKKSTKNSNSRHAQGGIAAAYAKDDSIASHMEDTLYAGCGHNDQNIVSDVLLDGKTIIENFLENDFPLTGINKAKSALAGKEPIRVTAYFMRAETLQAACLLITC